MAWQKEKEGLQKTLMNEFALVAAGSGVVENRLVTDGFGI